MNPATALKWQDVEIASHGAINLKEELPQGSRAEMIGDVRTAIIDTDGQRHQRAIPGTRRLPGSVLRQHDGSAVYMGHPEAFSTQLDLRFSTDAEELKGNFSVASYRGSHGRVKAAESFTVRVWYSDSIGREAANEAIPGKI